MTPRYFTSEAEFRDWLAAHHESVSELLVGFYKKAAPTSGITYQEAVDAALCFGWIDGVKKRVDEHRYTHRFTPRKRVSTWSLVNTKRARQLITLGRMAPAGHEVFKRRDARKTGIYQYERRASVFDAAIVKQFKANARAWTFFCAQPPGYQRLLTFWVMTAKQHATRLRRLDLLIEKSAKGTRLR